MTGGGSSPPPEPGPAALRWWVPLALILAVPAFPQGSGEGGAWTQVDPAKVVSAEACGECHVSAYEVWKRTPHATGFKTLHRKESAEAIAGRMGLKLIKRDSMCLGCHYTPEVKGEQVRAASGVSCESCHGAGADWIDLHNDYGGKGIDHKGETEEHRATRLRVSRERGMRRADDLYDLVSSCYGCHTVPKEDLVNVGRHSVGSSGFELASRVGEIRHNFLESFLDGDGTDNADRGPAHRRRLYAVGRALELEHALRGVAAASGKGVYLKAMQRRLRDAVVEVRALAELGDLEEARAMVAAVQGVRADPARSEALRAAADAVGEAARGFLGRHDGTRLASLDPLVTGEIAAADLDLEPPPVADGVRVAATDGVSPGDPAASAAPLQGSDAQGTGTVAARQAVAAIPAEGAVKTRIRERRSSNATLEASACQQCHGDQHAWWYEDPHYAAVERFLEGSPDAIRIARLYGLEPSQASRGNRVCMDCHGTVETGRESRRVVDGVSCQSCHGPAEKYLEPHQEGDAALGTRRPGYVEALRLGMVELQDAETRAATCTGCHYITDPRLISSGHPTGRDFDFVGNMAKIRHWEGEDPAAPGLPAAFHSALVSRGPVPQVRLARLASTVTLRGSGGLDGVSGARGGASGAKGGAGGPRGTAGASGSGRGLGTADNRRSHVAPAPRPATNRPAFIRRGGDPASAKELGLEPFPRLDGETPLEEVLLLVKQRLEAIYAAVGRGSETDGDGGKEP
ncbi:MAG: multiheme c-type cytochrome [Acidobacteriota bacterium]